VFALICEHKFESENLFDFSLSIVFFFRTLSNRPGLGVKQIILAYKFIKWRGKACQIEARLFVPVRLARQRPTKRLFST
jgi:hypothetical protein